MSQFRADLHIHSRFSRATSSKLNVRHLAAWGAVKGLEVLGTGDFTHPLWRQELRQQLCMDEESGLYRLVMGLKTQDIEAETPHAMPRFIEPRFMLQGEISSIYKKDGAVRKVHNLVYMPDLDSADKLCARLEAVGNLHSDGRPILGLDSRHLLEIVLECHPQAYLIPAHIWTPWFSLFGSKSGFNSIEACFDDLSSHIFALETGLSSDPDMNRCWSHLDGLALVSNSDAHSGENLGREANVFSGNMSYQGIFDALHYREGNTSFLGTVEFFPEEGKYHLDGHRACNVVLEPAESQELGNICPVCGKPLTVGVLHRVLELADRKAPLEPGKDFRSLIPLPEIVGELLGTGSKSKKVQEKLALITSRLGPELPLLLDKDLEEVKAFWPELGEGLRRMRAGQVLCKGGYDGEYGVVRLFSQAKQKVELNTHLLVPVQSSKKQGRTSRKVNKSIEKSQDSGEADPAPNSAPITSGDALAAIDLAPKPYSQSQWQAISAGPGPVLVLAGPGSGKTHTLSGRIALLLGQGVAARRIVALTYTRKAAAELRHRLEAMPFAQKVHQLPEVDTLHALALRHWPDPKPILLSEASAKQLYEDITRPQQADPEQLNFVMEPNSHQVPSWEQLSLLREKLHDPSPWRAYTLHKRKENLADFTDLLEHWLESLQHGDAPRPWGHVLVDEAQDLSPLQLALIQALLPENGNGLFAIGDPDQSIYGFRGASPNVAENLFQAYPHLESHGLTESHRSAAPVLKAAQDVLERALPQGPACAALRSTKGTKATLHFMEAPTPFREAQWIASRIANLLGGNSHTQADSLRTLKNCHLAPGSCSPKDIAILVRLKSLMSPLQKELDKLGLPCIVPQDDAFWLDKNLDSLFLWVRQPQKSPVPTALWEEPQRLLHWMQEQGQSPDPRAAKLLLQALKIHGSWQGLLDFIVLRQDQDLVRLKSEQVQILTIHASKGLEFKAVFLPCLEEGILPFAGRGIIPGQKPPLLLDSTDGQSLRQEEARLLYVAITRASEAIFASCSKTRSFHGQDLNLVRSSLLPTSHFHTIRLVPKVKQQGQWLSLS